MIFALAVFGNAQMCKSRYFIKVKRLHCRLEVSSAHEFALNATRPCVTSGIGRHFSAVYGVDLSQARRLQPRFQREKRNTRDTRSRILVESIFVSGTSLRPTSRRHGPRWLMFVRVM